MSEHDWRAMLADILAMGSPIDEIGIQHEERCRYCKEWSPYHPHHGETCDWHNAEEALIHSDA